MRTHGTYELNAYIILVGKKTELWVFVCSKHTLVEKHTHTCGEHTDLWLCDCSKLILVEKTLICKSLHLWRTHWFVSLWLFKTLTCGDNTDLWVYVCNKNNTNNVIHGTYEIFAGDLLRRHGCFQNGNTCEMPHKSVLSNQTPRTYTIPHTHTQTDRGVTTFIV